MKSERSKRWLTAIICALYLFTAYKCSGQTERIQRHNRPDGVITILASKSMKFNPGKNDTAYVSVMADSLGDNEYEASLIFFAPKSWKVADYSIYINFEDNSYIVVKPSVVHNRANAAEYLLTNSMMLKMKDKKIDVISFDNDSVMHPCTNIRTRNYFVDFFNSLK